mmetsp:Transcript_14877/g.42693  ORF Transcript_14877/g.42693 Transcript_14877/m.42693 type:complete len:494 (+) Transcript_14877:64-1545(+)
MEHWLSLPCRLPCAAQPPVLERPLRSWRPGPLAPLHWRGPSGTRYRRPTHVIASTSLARSGGTGPAPALQATGAGAPAGSGQAQRTADGALVAILAVSCLNLVGATAVAPVTPALMHHFALDSDASLGLMSSSFALGRFCTTSIWPIASDYVGRRRILCIAMVGGALSSMMQGAAISLDWPFAVFMLAHGIAGTFSGIVPVLKASIVDTFPADEVPKILAYREAASTFAFVVGPSIGGALAAWSFALPLYFAAGSGMLAALVAAYRIPSGLLPRASPGQEATARTRRAPASKEPRAVAAAAKEAAPLLLLSFVWACTRSCFHTYYPLMVARRCSLQTVGVGGVMTAVSLLVVLVQISMFEPARHRLGLAGTLALGGVLVSLGLLGIGSSPNSIPLGLFAVFNGLYAVGVALLSPAMPSMLVQLAPPGRCGLLLGIESATVNFARILAPPIFGLHLHSGSQVSGLATLAATTLVWRFARKHGRPSKPAATGRAA